MRLGLDLHVGKLAQAVKSGDILLYDAAPVEVALPGPQRLPEAVNIDVLGHLEINPDDLPSFIGAIFLGAGGGIAYDDEGEDEDEDEEGWDRMGLHQYSRMPSVLASKRMNCLRKVRNTLPVGPLRCLETINSAVWSSTLWS